MGILLLVGYIHACYCYGLGPVILRPRYCVALTQSRVIQSPVGSSNSAQKEYLALLVLSGANVTRFRGLRDKLKNESLFRNDNYPKDQAKLLHIMNKYKPELAHIV